MDMCHAVARTTTRYHSVRYDKESYKAKEEEEAKKKKSKWEKKRKKKEEKENGVAREERFLEIITE